MFQIEHEAEQGPRRNPKLFAAAIDDYILFRERDLAHGRILNRNGAADQEILGVLEGVGRAPGGRRYRRKGPISSNQPLQNSQRSNALRFL